VLIMTPDEGKARTTGPQDAKTRTRGRDADAGGRETARDLAADMDAELLENQSPEDFDPQETTQRTAPASREQTGSGRQPQPGKGGQSGQKPRARPRQG
jgi:hypothetical protein